jgi:hypothetical protein
MRPASVARMSRAGDRPPSCLRGTRRGAGLTEAPHSFPALAARWYAERQCGFLLPLNEAAFCITANVTAGDGHPPARAQLSDRVLQDAADRSGRVSNFVLLKTASSDIAREGAPGEDQGLTAVDYWSLFKSYCDQ